MKLRPHHLFCRRFLRAELPDREADFREVERRIDRITQTVDEVMIEVILGVDGLCRVCPHCQDDRCRHPQGEEEAVRKWDAIILRSLGISYGETRTSKKWRTLIEEKAPLDFCRTRCPSKPLCAVTRLAISP